jgi:hypothetical protein
MRRLSRRRFLGTAAGAVVAIAAGPAGAWSAPVAPRSRYLTQPGFDPPLVDVRAATGPIADGLILVAPFALGTTAPSPAATAR